MFHLALSQGGGPVKYSTMYNNQHMVMEESVLTKIFTLCFVVSLNLPYRAHDEHARNTAYSEENVDLHTYCFRMAF